MAVQLLLLFGCLLFWLLVDDCLVYLLLLSLLLLLTQYLIDILSYFLWLEEVFDDEASTHHGFLTEWTRLNSQVKA